VTTDFKKYKFFFSKKHLIRVCIVLAVALFRAVYGAKNSALISAAEA